jgi:hypothetical protein
VTGTWVLSNYDAPPPVIGGEVRLWHTGRRVARSGLVVGGLEMTYLRVSVGGTVLYVRQR